MRGCGNIENGSKTGTCGKRVGALGVWYQIEGEEATLEEEIDTGNGKCLKVDGRKAIQSLQGLDQSGIKGGYNMGNGKHNYTKEEQSMKKWKKMSLEYFKWNAHVISMEKEKLRLKRDR